MIGTAARGHRAGCHRETGAVAGTRIEGATDPNVLTDDDGMTGSRVPRQDATAIVASPASVASPSRRAALCALLAPIAAARATAGDTRSASPAHAAVWRFDATSPFALPLSALPEAPEAARVALRMNLLPATRGHRRPAESAVTLQTQCPEWQIDGDRLRFVPERTPARQPGAAAWRFQVEATRADGSVHLSGPIVLVAESPLAVIRRGADSWPSFAALTRAAATRRELIGATFEITPGMFAEGRNGMSLNGPGPVATIAFPCTVKALDPARPPVFLSISGERDVIQIEARGIEPIDGEVVLQDLVVRDNRSHYDTGEAGVRLKDRWPGRSVRIERCEFLRCQNAVAGGALGQRLTIADCRIVDCGLGGQAHGVYVGTEWLDFHGNVVLLSAGNRLARAHLLKCRSLHARVLGNRFEMPDATGSFLVDMPNGGALELGGNLLHYGVASDNRQASLVVYGAEGAQGDWSGGQGRPFVFAPGRRFSLVMRNNTLWSDFAGRTTFVAIDERRGVRAEGGQADAWPDPLIVQDNLFAAAGRSRLVVRRSRIGFGEEDVSSWFRANSRATSREREARPLANAGGAYAARRFNGHTRLGTGSVPHEFRSQGARG